MVSLVLETIFSLKRAYKISGFPSLSWSDFPFLVSPKSVKGDGGRGVEGRKHEGEREGKSGIGSSESREEVGERGSSRVLALSGF